jgi:hypothetical protein
MALCGPPVHFISRGKDLQIFRLEPSLEGGDLLTCQITSCSPSNDYYYTIKFEGVDTYYSYPYLEDLGVNSGPCGLSATVTVSSYMDVIVRVGLDC